MSVYNNLCRCVGGDEVKAVSRFELHTFSMKANPGLFRLARLISARVAFHERDLRESPLSNHGNLSDQPNLVGSRLAVKLS